MENINDNPFYWRRLSWIDQQGRRCERLVFYGQVELEAKFLMLKEYTVEKLVWKVESSRTLDPIDWVSSNDIAIKTINELAATPHGG